MIIRRFQQSDCRYLAQLFYNTVHSINAKDYTKQQLNAWAPENIDLESWNKSLSEHYTIVAVKDEILVGFGNIDRTGYLDMLYIHKDYQNKGIATAICEELEQVFNVCKIITHASITAKPFFEKRSYKMIKKQEVERKGVLLKNYIMELSLF